MDEEYLYNMNDTHTFATNLLVSIHCFNMVSFKSVDFKRLFFVENNPIGSH